MDSIVWTKDVKRARFLKAFASLSLSATLLPVPSASWQVNAQKRLTPRFLAPLTLLPILKLLCASLLVIYEKRKLNLLLT